MGAAADLVFYLNPGSALSWRELDGQWLVYDAGSGQTHLLDPLTAAVLGLVEAAPVGWAALLATLADAMAPPSAVTLAAGVRTALDGLLAIGVVESRVD